MTKKDKHTKTKDSSSTASSAPHAALRASACAWSCYYRSRERPHSSRRSGVGSLCTVQSTAEAIFQKVHLGVRVSKPIPSRQERRRWTPVASRTVLRPGIADRECVRGKAVKTLRRAVEIVDTTSYVVIVSQSCATSSVTSRR